MPKPADPAADEGLPNSEIAAREAFETKYAAWAREIIDYSDPGSSPDRIARIETNNRDLELAIEVLAAPIPLGFLMQKKLDVMQHYMATCGARMCPLDRLVFLGLGALRVDVVYFNG